MSLNFSAWSIRQPIPAIVLFVVLMLVGTISFFKLPVTRFPNIDIPIVQITVTQSGAAPAELETQVTKKVEDAVASITGVKHIVSTVTDGTSSTLMEFRLEVNTDRALNDVKDAIAKIRADLPRTIDEPVIQRVDVEGQSILTYAASAPGMTMEELSWHVDDVIKRKLQGLRGVGRVERYGGVTREIVISLDPDRLLALGITAGEVNRQLRATNVDLGGGRGEVGGQEQAIRTLAGARDVSTLADTKIALTDGRQVRLKELGRVEDSTGEPRSFARLDRQPVVSFSVFRAKNESELAVGKEVERAVEDLRKANPDVRMTLIDDAVTYTVGNYDAAMETLIEGAVLAVLVVFAFLRNVRATLIAAVALPLSAVPAFWAMSAMGFSLNLVSLLGITLVTGILVDDAIVEIENIVRHMRMGKSPYRAAIEAADEIGLAVIAITFTIVAVFVPVSFMGGIAGQYFRQFGLTVAAAVLISLLVARLITPMMAAYLMRPVPFHDGRDGFVMRAYAGLLQWTLGRTPLFRLRLRGGDRVFHLRHSYVTLVLGLALFAASLWSTQLLPTGFLPAGDESRIVISAELPPGSTLEDTRRSTDEMAKRIRQVPGVKSVFVLGGATPTGQGLEIRKAAIFVRLLPKKDRALSQKQIENRLNRVLAEVPDARVWYVNARGQREASLSVVAEDGDRLDAAVAALVSQMRRQPGFSNVASSAALDRPEIRITPKADKAASLGVTPEAMSEAVRIATIGDIDANLAKFNAGDRLVPIRVQLREGARGNMAEIAALRVAATGGRSVPLETVADVTFSQGPSSVERYDRRRRAVIGADLAGGLTIDQAVAIIKNLPAAKALPPGVRLQDSGDAETSNEVREGFLTAMGIGMVLVLGVLVLLFGSLFPPVTILLSLPLSFGGVVVALLLTNNPVSMPVFIGVLMLMGVVTKNAIMLVEFAVEARMRGVDRIAALLEAGRKRARPIIMTTIAMVAGMVPSAYGLGDGGEFRAPMAIAVMGGLVVSTLLSLVFVPSFYLVMDDLGSAVSRLFGRFVGKRDEPEEETHAPAGRPQPAARLAAE